jgi:hypothetical protein
LAAAASFCLEEGIIQKTISYNLNRDILFLLIFFSSGETVVFPLAMTYYEGVKAIREKKNTI